MSITKKGSRSSGGSLPGGLKMATGIIYLKPNPVDPALEPVWDLLNNVDHATFNIDSVSQSGGIVSVNYASLGLTKIVSFSAKPDDTLTALGITIGEGAGLNELVCKFNRSQDYSTLYYVSYNGVTWSIQQYGGAVADTPSIGSFNPATGIITINHTTPMGYPILDIKTGGAGYQNYRVIEFSSAYGYTNESFKLIDWAGGVYTPINGDWFMFERKSRWISGAVAPKTNSPTNIFTAGLKEQPLSTFNDLPVSGGGNFTNFEVLVFGM